MSQLLRQIRLLVLDLDFLVYDCAALKVQALRQSLVSFSDQIPQNVRLPDAVDIEEAFRASGSHWIRSLDIGLKDQELRELEKLYRIREARFVDTGAGGFFPGILELLSSCRREGLIFALGAETDRDYLMSVCDRHDMDRFFEIVLCAEEYGMGSTDEMLAEIMSRAEVNASETLALGTRPFYFEAGHNLDILSIGCGWGLHNQEGLESADFQSPSLEHLLPLIRQADALLGSYSN